MASTTSWWTRLDQGHQRSPQFWQSQGCSPATWSSQEVGDRQHCTMFSSPPPSWHNCFYPGVLLAPLNIQAQNTINKRGEITPKNQLIHDQSWKWQLRPSVNSRVDTNTLMACYFGRAMRWLIKWAAVAKKLHPNKRFLGIKLDVKAAYRRCHLNTMIALQTCTQLSHLKVLPWWCYNSHLAELLAHQNGDPLQNLSAT